MTVKPIVQEIRIQNRVIFLDLPIEYGRQTWVRQLHDWIGRSIASIVGQYLTGSPGVVSRLLRIQSSRYEIGLQMQSVALSETTYISLVRAMTGLMPSRTGAGQLTRFADNTLQRSFALPSGYSSSRSGVLRSNTRSTGSVTRSRTGSSSLQSSTRPRHRSASSTTNRSSRGLTPSTIRGRGTYEQVRS